LGKLGLTRHGVGTGESAIMAAKRKDGRHPKNHKRGTREGRLEIRRGKKKIRLHSNGKMSRGGIKHTLALRPTVFLQKCFHQRRRRWDNPVSRRGRARLGGEKKQSSRTKEGREGKAEDHRALGAMDWSQCTREGNVPPPAHWVKGKTLFVANKS